MQSVLSLRCFVIVTSIKSTVPWCFAANRFLNVAASAGGRGVHWCICNVKPAGTEHHVASLHKCSLIEAKLGQFSGKVQTPTKTDSSDALCVYLLCNLIEHLYVHCNLVLRVSFQMPTVNVTQHMQGQRMCQDMFLCLWLHIPLRTDPLHLWFSDPPSKAANFVQGVIKKAKFGHWEN